MLIASKVFWDAKISLSAEAIDELHFWSQNIDSLSPRVISPWFRLPERIIYTDASDHAGAGILLDESSETFHCMWDDFNKAQSSTFRELKAVELLLKTMGSKLENKFVKLYSDNQNVIRIVQVGSMKNIVEEPVGIELWKSEFDVTSEAFSKIWEHVNMYWKPSNLVELDFKVLHNCIFTNVKLQKIGLVDDNICKVCCSEKEDILHIFMNCDKLEDFHNYLSSLLVRIFENCDSDKISLVRSEELLILGLRWHMKGVNDSFLNFFMSVARYCIFRRRNLLNSGYSNVNLIKLFQYTLKHYVTYMYVYLCQSHNMSHIFQKKFVMDNPLLEETDNVLVFKL